MQKKVVKTYIDALKNSGIISDYNLSDNILQTQVDCISYDNRKLYGNSIFICKGANFKPEYAKQAFDSGSLLYISVEKIKSLDNYVIVSDIRKTIQILANLYFEKPADKLALIGITGTKGKSSITYIMQSILNSFLLDNNKNKCAIISSIETYDGKNMFESHLTTPEIIELQEHFYNAVSSNIEYLVMEVSSQALKYGRVKDVLFDVVCFSNFGKDHISSIEHSDVEDYFNSKIKIFDNAKFACVNSESDRAEEVLKQAKKNCQVITYGCNSGDDICCSNIKTFPTKVEFHVKTPYFEKDVVLGIPGLFNVSNALAAIAICSCINISEKYILKGLENASVPGRMKIVQSKDHKITIIVDYAHNEMSFNALYESIEKEYVDNKVIAIFGCPGLKALDRRESLPKIASKYSDHIIITEEDSGVEDFENIAKDLTSNITINNYEVIEDRDKAIKHAIFDLSYNNTVIVLTGKGEETRLKRGDNYDPCESDLDIAKKYIEEYDRTVNK